MSNGLSLKATLVVALIALSAASLIPTVFEPGPGEPIPDWYKSVTEVWDHKLNLGLDLQGGLLLQYRVEVEKAVSDKTDRLEDDLKKRLVAKDATVKPETRREGIGAIFVKFDNPSKTALLDEDFLGFFPNLKKTELTGGEIKLEMSETFIEETQDYAIEQAIGTIRERVDALGVAEPDIKKSGKTDIVIQLPGLNEKDRARAKNLIGTTAQLEFKMVAEGEINPFFSKFATDLPAGLTYTNERGQATIRAQKKDDLKAFFKGKVEDKYQVVYEEIVSYKDKLKTEKDVENSYWRSHLVFSQTELTGEYITNSQISVDNRTNKPYVSLTFDATGADLFGKITKANVDKRFAILLDDVMKSDPVINEPILGGRAQITMGGYKGVNELFAEAKDLTIVLRHGALPAPIHKQFETSVGPSLGADSIAKGQLSLMIAGIMVILFMLIYYRGGGLVANLALTLNVLLVGAALSALNATLTLPGIAGIILTIGMAVDANVIIFERVKEELRHGKSPKAALQSGYGKALSAVLDANITTAIAAAVLMQYGSGPIRGFAVTLLVGIICSVFTAVIVTRIVYDFVIDRFKPESLSI